MNLLSGAQLYYTWDENTENLKTQKSKDHNQGHLSLSMTKRGKPKLKRKMGVTQLIKIRVKFKRNLLHFCLFQITLRITMITRDSFPVFLYWYFTDQDYLCHKQFFSFTLPSIPSYVPINGGVGLQISHIGFTVARFSRVLGSLFT